VKRRDAFMGVCGHLRAGLLGGEAPPDRGISWEALVDASSHHNVTPALAWCLEERPGIPAEARDFFAGVLALNRRRNEALLAALARIVAACNAVGIAPVPLKGAARLVECSYPDPSIRFLGDLDVLIPAGRAADAVAALARAGFCPSGDREPVPSHHHLPLLHGRDPGGGVELHIDILPGEGSKVIPTDWYNAGTRACAWRNLHIGLASVTCSVGHIIAHDQLAHAGYRRGKVELRQLLDVAVLRSVHAATIDWGELDRRFHRIGLGEVLATYLEFVEVLLGQPAPRLSSPPRPGAIREFGRRLDRARLPRLASIVTRYAAACRQDPRGALQFFNLRKWPARIRLVMDALDRNSSFGFRGDYWG
jgi:hypothetical protein